MQPCAPSARSCARGPDERCHSDVDDAPARGDAARRSTADEDGAHEVGPDHLVQLFVARPLDRGEIEDGGIVHDDVDFSPLLQRSGEEFLDVRDDGDVRTDGQRAST
jgi:hypothetical protein